MEPLANNDPILAETPDAPKQPSRWAGLGTRALSSAVLIAVFLAVLFIGGWLFNWLVIMAALMMMREWTGLTKTDGPLWRFAGLFYVSVPCASLLWLRQVQATDNPHAGIQLVLFIMLIVWATDIGAYFTGRKVGGPKLSPIISPNKTWAGLGGGVGAAATTAALVHWIFPYPDTMVKSILLGAVMAIISQMGDLLESWMKRRAGVKDSGTLIPGHGGLLDRIDGLVPTLPLFAWIICLSGYGQ